MGTKWLFSLTSRTFKQTQKTWNPRRLCTLNVVQTLELGKLECDCGLSHQTTHPFGAPTVSTQQPQTRTHQAPEQPRMSCGGDSRDGRSVRDLALFHGSGVPGSWMSGFKGTPWMEIVFQLWERKGWWCECSNLNPENIPGWEHAGFHLQWSVRPLRGPEHSGLVDRAASQVC